jgi:hypothetical protein
MTNLFRQGVLASLRPRGEAEGSFEVPTAALK